MTPAPEKEAAALLMLNRLGIAGRRKALAALRDGKSATEVLESFSEDSEAIVKSFDAGKEMALCWQKGINLLSILDPCYPALLKEIPDPPLLLYIKGEIQENDANALAVVGTRHPSFYGKMQSKRFAGDLAAKGLTIVSGLARGIDQIAHEAALEIPFGRTIAVLGSGVDVIYPPENEKLYRRVLERGAIVSEYSTGTPPIADNFPRRNRIISGLSLGALVVEAHSRSGSLITAHQALEQGREVFAIPGPVDQLTSRGTHQLLKEGAALVESPEDVFETLGPRLKEIKRLAPSFVTSQAAPGPAAVAAVFPSIPAPEAKNLDWDAGASDEGVVLGALAEEGELAPDDILDITGSDPVRFPMLLLKLELAGKIRRTINGKYVRCPK